MSIIVAPDNLSMGDQCKVSQMRYDQLDRSDQTGSAQARILGLPRWKMTLICNEICTLDEGALWESIILRLRGSINHLLAYDYFKQRPLGTLQTGPLTVNVAAVAGDTTISLSATAANAGKTLAIGDWLQFGSGLGTSHYCKVVALATFNGSGVANVTVEPPLRYAFQATSAVIYVKAATYYKATSVPEWQYNYGGQAQEGFALDLLEQWS